MKSANLITFNQHRKIMESLNARNNLNVKSNRFGEILFKTGRKIINRATISTLQISLGKLCNQACKHCHVEAGPKREEIMSQEVADRLTKLGSHPSVQTIDLTGGAPEMNPHFKGIVETLSGLNKEILVRCNLTIMEEPGYEWLPEFYAAQKVTLICSLPCYTEENVNAQRGNGVYKKSIKVLKRLNGVGFGAPSHPAGLKMHLVYNPGGPSLPASQLDLEADYKRELEKNHGITFNSLYTMTNIPIGRFGNTLRKTGGLENYISLLEEAFNPGTVEQLMCRYTLNVGWDGKLYDCDFNQMLSLEIDAGRISLFDQDFSLEDLRDIPIRTGEHCLACTAGAGSSCGGVLD